MRSSYSGSSANMKSKPSFTTRFLRENGSYKRGQAVQDKKRGQAELPPIPYTPPNGNRLLGFELLGVAREDRLVSLVYLVCLVCLVEPDRPDKPDGPDGPDRPGLSECPLGDLIQFIE